MSNAQILSEPRERGLSCMCNETKGESVCFRSLLSEKKGFVNANSVQNPPAVPVVNNFSFKFTIY